jgi:SAM-dependent methyltransferase
VGDLLQFKPGEFELDECATCGHIFQNPRLSLEGLDFYYRDFYDGMGAELLDFVFSSDDTSYRGRVDLVAAHASPKRWLDVGAGHGHFCLVASEVLPDTRFEGLDLSDSIVEAERHRWVERAHVGLFPELADQLAETYDVVSMHHYLEHTREPADELEAAAKVLGTGGHLLIEVPDPEAAFGRILGPMWGPWFQPQHQHLLSIGNLAAMLADRGFTVVAEERGPAHQPADLAFALVLLANRIAGPPRKPWVESRRLRARVRRAVCFPALVPLAVAALILDRLIAPVVSRRPGGSNAYRILARKN